ncbi:response regulator transcription factor [Nocardiopsis sp. CT-R113]|uniref:Response regulator transcription factor n=1 Tax=Nocardiopsis codii TaxID=3065942 RepID=A0ABU7K5W4_9ACTN|nr:response regulator transcription factor [Nocardiopsis sp. CT-R113]MEE2037641.1 response regulator transcription factor [Nocardiopsis sp. CT-R113]
MRVVIAEDSALLREGLVQMVTMAGHHVAEAVEDAPGLLRAVAEHEPDVAVTDIRMPPNNSDDGLRAALSITRSHPDVGILVLSQYVIRGTATELLNGATAGIGYLLKDRVGEVDELIKALEQVAARGTVIDSEVVRRLLERQRNHSVLDRLTPRERQVIELMAQGRSNAAISAELSITEAAVAKNISGIFTKFDLPVAPQDNRRVLAVLVYLGN